MTKTASNGGLRCLSSQRMNVILTTIGRKYPGELPPERLRQISCEDPATIAEREPT